MLLWTGSFESIVLYAGVGLALFSMLAVGSIYILRRTRPDLPRPFRTPGYPVVPAVFLVATALLTGAAFVERPRVSLYSLLSILSGIPIYYLAVRPGRRASAEPRRADEGAAGPASPSPAFSGARAGASGDRP